MQRVAQVESPETGSPGLNEFNDLGILLNIDSLSKEYATQINDLVTPLDILGPDLGRLELQFLLEAASGSQWPITVANTLTVLSGLVGPLIRVGPGPRARTWLEPIIIWSGAVAPTGAGKTPAQKPISAALELTQRIAQLYCKRLGVSVAHLPNFICTAKTIEKLLADLASSPDSTQIRLYDELSEFVTGFNQYKSGGGGSDVEIVISLKNGSTQRHSTLSSKVPSVIHHPHFVVGGNLQPQTFLRLFFNSKAEANGFANRFVAFHATHKGRSPETAKKEREARKVELDRKVEDPPARQRGIEVLRKVMRALPDEAPVTDVPDVLSSTLKRTAAGVSDQLRMPDATEPDEELANILDSLKEVSESAGVAPLLEDADRSISARDAAVQPPSWFEKAGLFLTIYLGTRFLRTQGGITRLAPAAKDFVLSDNDDPDTPSYKLFDSFVKRLDAACAALNARGKEDRAGRIGKMAGEVLQLAALLHICSAALQNPILARLYDKLDMEGVAITQDATGQGTPAPLGFMPAATVISEAAVQYAINISKFHLTQLVLVLEDLDMYETCDANGLLVVKVVYANPTAGPTIDNERPGEDKARPGINIGDDAPNHRPTTASYGIYPDLVRSFFRGYTGESALNALGSAKGMSPFKGQPPKGQEKFNFDGCTEHNSLLARSLAAGKVFGKFKGADTLLALKALGGGKVASLCIHRVMRVAAGMGADVAMEMTNEVTKKYKDDTGLMHQLLRLLAPKDAGSLPAICSLAQYVDLQPVKAKGAVTGSADSGGYYYMQKLLPSNLNTVSLQHGITQDVRDLHQALVQLKTNCTVYGMDLNMYHQPASVVMQRVESLLAMHGGVAATEAATAGAGGSGQDAAPSELHMVPYQGQAGGPAGGLAGGLAGEQQLSARTPPDPRGSRYGSLGFPLDDDDSDLMRDQ